MEPRKHLILALLLVAAVALIAAGCGGGDGDDTTAPVATTVEEPTALTKAELIERGDGICGEVNAAVGAIGASEEGEVAEQTEEVAGLYTGMIESIKDLGEPQEAEGYEEFIAAADELAKVEGEIKLAAERSDTAALGEAATESAPILEEFQAQAAIYGFEECSEGPSAPSAIPGTSAGAGTEEGGGEIEEGGVEVAPEIEEEILPEEVAPEVEEVAPETGGGVGGEEGVAPESGGEEGSSGGGIGPG
jgi:hypothetical protein